MALMLSWPGGEHQFKLALGELRALQSVCDAGPQEVYNRVRLGAWLLDDLYETIRQGLMGGGMSRDEASKLTLQMFERHPLKEFEPIASAILLVALVGEEPDEGEPRGETSPPENGVSPQSTATEQ